MGISLGVDTGGTYTDAVLIEDETRIIAKAKALTTKQNLAIGISGAIRSVLEMSHMRPDQISLASLSTTLATNALVEGQGERAALIFVGFSEKDLEGHGLKDALKGDPVLVLRGGHDHAGQPRAELDETSLEAFLAQDGAQVDSFAVAAQFAVRNPEHELRCVEVIRERTGRPVSASYQLSSKLGGPKRALTALLNARLIGLIDRLIQQTETQLGELGINAPLMVVRGDGALISAEQARHAPIETILSGPAASIVGAKWLTQMQDALVSDIGGTTTDVALLKDGRPSIDPQGAQVGPYRTMVEAVAMRTTGLGGDSAVHLATEGLAGEITLGPQRVVPVSLLATEADDTVHAALDASLRSATPHEHDAAFARILRHDAQAGLGTRELTLLSRLEAGVQPLAQILKNRMEQAALNRLVARGVVQISAPTPSDASHVLGSLKAWDGDAASKALELLARKRTGAGERFAKSAQAIARRIVNQLTQQTSIALLESAFFEDAEDFGGQPKDLARHALVQRGLNNHHGVFRISTGLNVPVIGLGASARNYYPAVGERVGTQVSLPEDGDVANAIGAVVGNICVRKTGTVTAPSEGQFRIHFSTGPVDMADEARALDAMEEELRRQARGEAAAAGADAIQVVAHRDIRKARLETRDVFVEATIVVEATGRPRVAV